MGKQKGSVSSNKIIDYYSVASSTKRSSGTLNHISTAEKLMQERLDEMQKQIHDVFSEYAPLLAKSITHDELIGKLTTSLSPVLQTFITDFDKNSDTKFSELVKDIKILHSHIQNFHSNGILSQLAKIEINLNNYKTQQEKHEEERKDKERKDKERKKETSSTSSSSTGKTSSSTTTTTAGKTSSSTSTSTKASTSSSKLLNNITNKRKETVAFFQSDVGKKQRKNGWKKAEVTDLKNLVPHFCSGNRIQWKKLMKSEKYKNSSIRQDRTYYQVSAKFREMEMNVHGKKKEVGKRSWNKDLEELLLEGVQQYGGYRNKFSMIKNDQKYVKLHGFKNKQLSCKNERLMKREGQGRNFRPEFTDDEMDAVVNGLVKYGCKGNWAKRLLKCPTYGKILKNRNNTEIIDRWSNMKRSCYETKEMLVEKYPKLQNFFYEKKIYSKIEEEFDNSEDVAKKLVDFATEEKLEFKNDLENMTSTDVTNVFFSQIIEQVPHFQAQSHREMFIAILKEFSEPDKSTIEGYVRNRMPSLKEDATNQELLLRTFTIYDLVHKRNVIAEAIKNNTCLLLKDKENKYRVYIRVPNNLQRELCRGARTQKELGNYIHSPISSLSEQPLLIELFESTVIEINHKYKDERDYSNTAYFKHSGCYCLKRYMYSAKDGGYIDYRFNSGEFGLSIETICSYRFFHIVLDNLKMSLRHTPAIEKENTTVGMYFFKYEEPEDAASAFCDVDHLFDRDHLYLQSFMLTTPVGHGLNGKLTDWRKKAGNWCYLLDQTKSYNYE